MKKPFITVIHNHRELKVPLDEISYISGLDSYSRINRTTGEVYTLSYTLKYIDNKNPGAFIRVHKQYLVNPKYITGHLLSRGEQSIVNLNGFPIPVARRRLKEVIKRLTNG